MTAQKTIEKKEPTKQLTWDEQRRISREIFFNVEIDLEKFIAHSSFSYDDRFRWHDYRVRTEKEIGDWIYDTISDRDKPQLTELEVKTEAFEAMKALQARKGQINRQNVYTRGVEEVRCFDSKSAEHASVSVVQDCADQLWRMSTSYWLDNSGASSGIWFRDKTVFATRDAALIAGGRRILASISEETSHYGKIKAFVESIEDTIRQPSLFG